MDNNDNIQRQRREERKQFFLNNANNKGQVAKANRSKVANTNTTGENRHYCKVCNTWMSNDRISILTHNNGKKHIKCVEDDRIKKIQVQNNESKKYNQIQTTLQLMENSAIQSFQQYDYSNYKTNSSYNANNGTYNTFRPQATSFSSIQQQQQYQSPNIISNPYQQYYQNQHEQQHIQQQQIYNNNDSQNQNQQSSSNRGEQQQQQSLNIDINNDDKKMKQDWEERKKRKREEEERKYNKDESDDDDDNNINPTIIIQSSCERTAETELNEGYYTIETEKEIMIEETHQQEQEEEEQQTPDTDIITCKNDPIIPITDTTCTISMNTCTTETTKSTTIVEDSMKIKKETNYDDKDSDNKDNNDDENIKNSNIQLPVEASIIDTNDDIDAAIQTAAPVEVLSSSRPPTQEEDTNSKTATTSTSFTISNNNKSIPHKSSVQKSAVQKTTTTKTIVTTTTYLVGSVYGATIIENDMPIQLWIGSKYATLSEQKLLYNQHLWINALVLQKRKIRSIEQHDITTIPNDVVSSNGIPTPTHTAATTSSNTTFVVDVAYLRPQELSQSSLNNNDDNKDSDAETYTKDNLDNKTEIEGETEEDDEVIEKSVQMNRIRIQLGSVHDLRIPRTIEEARIILMGGEEIININSNDNNQNSTTNTDTTLVTQNKNETIKKEDNTSTNVTGNCDVIVDTDDDINDGLTSWSTVQIRRTTEITEQRKERIREQQQQIELLHDKEKTNKDIERRRMEEARLFGAGDSALGSYDIWNRGTKDGYKGYQIESSTITTATTATTTSDSYNKERQRLTVHDVMGKKLASGKVQFKSKKKKTEDASTTILTTVIDNTNEDGNTANNVVAEAVGDTSNIVLNHPEPVSSLSSFKKASMKKKQNRRTTSADDD